MLFLGELITQTGVSQLVVVYRQTWGRGEDTFGTPIRVLTMTPKTLSDMRAPVLFSETIGSPHDAFSIPVTGLKRLRFWLGQRDRTDPAHFVVPYALDDEKGCLEGWLRNVGSVEMRFTSGPGFAADGPH
jgi:hypothetical protein